MVTSANKVTVDNNVIFYSHIGGIFQRESNDTTITNNLIGALGRRYWAGGNDTRLDEIAAMMV
jgi:parallel beta-helix repeat protein